MNDDIEIVGSTHSGDVDRDRRDAAHAAALIAPALADITVTDPSLRPDVGNIQVDFGYIHRGATIHQPICRLTFRMAGNFGAELNIRLDELRADPTGYVRNLLEHLGPMRRNSQKLRARKRDANAAIYRSLEQQHG